MGVLEDKLKLLPDNPGVYVMQNADGQIIYVGKAKNLKNRVRQYFQSGVKTDKVMAMVNNVADFYYFITPSEIDALSLENNLIKKHKPRYNILLKDDKTYPYIKIDVKNEFPTAKITRKIVKDGAKYFGPYMGGINVQSVLEILNLAFNIRLCDKKINLSKPVKPCLNWHIGKCFAPCAGLIDATEYKKQVESAINFLNGDLAYAQKILTKKMMDCAENQEFELALKYKESLNGLEKIKLKRLTSLNKFIDADVIAYKNNGIYSAVNVLIVRSGKMLGGKNFSFTSTSFSDSDAISEFISRFYQNNNDIPEEIILQTELSDERVIEEFLKQKAEKSVSILCPKQGVRAQLINMALVNASEHLETAVDKILHKEDMTVKACKRLQEILSLQKYPKRMECYDISNISGVDKVGSMVVFYDGESDRDSYRRFKIKSFEGADDFRSLQEVLRRRLQRLTTDSEKFPKPDLIVIDGGKGQLSSVKEVFDEFNITDIDLISLAEKEEEIFTLYSPISIRLERSDYCLRMLQRIRDEAHRFAVTYHTNLRSKRALSSVLNKVNGLGKVKIKALLEKFGDLSGIISASMDELCSVNGIGQKQAGLIMETLAKEGLK